MSTSSCADNSAGRPPADAAYSHFKVQHGSAAAQATICDATIAAALIGEAVIEQAAIDGLVVNTLAVTGDSPALPSVISLPGLAAVIGGSASYAYPALYTFSAADETFTWTLNVSPSATRAIRFRITAGTVSVSVNGTDLGNLASNAVRTTDTFDWAGGSMIVVITSVGAGATIQGDPIII